MKGRMKILIGYDGSEAEGTVVALSLEKRTESGP
jgi:hypothetical protein